MADLGSIAALKAAWDAIVNNSVPDESIEPDDHNGLIDDLLDTTAGLDKVLRHNNATGGYDLTISEGDLVKLLDSGFSGDIDTATLTADRTYTFQDASGVVAFLSDIPAGVTELNDLSDVNTGLPVSPTQADDGKMLFFDTSVGDFITDDTVTHGTSVINGKKASAGTIAKGKPVYLVGFDADLHTVEEANATSSATMPVIGFAAETMDDTNSKHIMTFGKLTGIDTSIYSVGDDLYIDTSTGGLTTTRPTGTALIQRVAKVLRSDVSGGQLLIFNTARTAGLPNLPQNNFWIGDANAEPQANTAAQARTVLNVADGANNYTHPNHTGEVTSTGDGATVVESTAITAKTAGTVASGDLLLISDIDDTNNLKKVTAQSIADLGAGGNTIYTGDDSLSGPRTVDLAGNQLTFSSATLNNVVSIGSGGNNRFTEFKLTNDVGTIGLIDTFGSLYSTTEVRNKLVIQSGSSSAGMLFRDASSSDTKWAIGASFSDAGVYQKWNTSGVLIGAGIGAETVGARLHVVGDIKAESSIGNNLFSVSTTGNVDITKQGATDQFINITNSNASNFTGFNLVNNAGGCGILETYGTTDGLTYRRNKFVISSGSTSAGMIIRDSSATAINFAIDATLSDATIDMKLTNVGLVIGQGVGAISPLAKTHIKGAGSTSGTSALFIENSAATTMFQVRNDNAIGMYGVTPVVQATTAGAAATFVANTSGISDDTATWGGYTVGQVVQALQNIGILQ